MTGLQPVPLTPPNHYIEPGLTNIKRGYYYGSSKNKQYPCGCPFRNIRRRSSRRGELSLMNDRCDCCDPIDNSDKLIKKRRSMKKKVIKKRRSMKKKKTKAQKNASKVMKNFQKQKKKNPDYTLQQAWNDFRL